jgi:hypothetical protein
MKQHEAIARIWELSGNTLNEEDVRRLVACPADQLAWVIRGFASQNDALKRRRVWGDIQRTVGQVEQWESFAENMASVVAGIPTLL